MSSVFSNNVVTQAGLRLIAAATATNPIVYVDALSASQIPQDPEAIPFYNGVDGIIDASSATDNTARIVSRFGNSSSSTAQPVKAIAITARLSSQSDSDKVIFAYCSDADSQIVFPQSSAPVQRTRFAFNITFDGQNTVEVVEAGCASLSDLERFVSIHKAGDPTDGEDQSVKGWKTFEDEVSFNDSIHLATNIVPSQASTYKIGESVGSRLSDVYTKTLHVGTVIGGNAISSNWNVELGNSLVPESSTVTNYVSSVGLGSNNYRFGGVYASAVNGMSLEVRSSSTSISGQATLSFGEDALMTDKDIVPANNASNIQTCGRISRPWKELYVRDAIYLTYGDTTNTTLIIYEDDGCISFDNSYMSGGDAGTFSFRKRITGGSFTGASVYAGEFLGANPTISRSSISPIPSSEVVPDVYDGDVVTIPVGGLILVSPDPTWMRNGGSGRKIKPGDLISITSSNKDAFLIADWNVDASSGSRYTGKSLDTMNTYAFLKVGTYRALSYITYPANSQSPTYGAPILLQRVS